MGYIDAKIYRLKTLFILFLTCILHISLVAKDDMNATAYEITCPFYQDGNDIPVLILRSKRAKPIGVRIELKGVQLDWIGDSLKEIKGVVATNSAIYDKSTQQITGNEQILYRSNAMDLDGIGFDIDQIKQTIHIRSEVKVVLKGKIVDPKRGKTERIASGGKISLKKSRQVMVIERIIDKEKEKIEEADKEIKKEIEKHRVSSFDWSGWFWFFVLVIFTFVTVKILLNKKRKRDSGESSGRKIFK